MWLDKISAQQILKLRDKFNIKTLVETGGAEGNNAIFYSHFFDSVASVEIDPKLVGIARRRAKENTPKDKRPYFYRGESPEYMAFSKVLRQVCIDYGSKETKNSTYLFILDAHTPNNWPLQGELKALKGFRNCCVVIHDFKVEGLGYVSYHGQDLDFNYVKQPLLEINPDFKFYVNSRDKAEIVTESEVKEGKIEGLINDKYTLSRLQYAWSSPVKTWRGILYATPAPLGPEFELVPLKCN